MNKFEYMLKEQGCRDDRINEEENLDMALCKSEITEWENQRYICELERQCEEQDYEIQELQEKLKKKNKKKLNLKKERAVLKNRITVLQEQVKAEKKKYKKALKKMKKKDKKRKLNTNTARQNYSREEVLDLLIAVDRQNKKCIPSREKDIIDVDISE